LARCLSPNCDPSPDFIGQMGFVCGASNMHQATHWLGPEPGLSGRTKRTELHTPDKLHTPDTHQIM
jgi:hypothetical protein